MARKSRDFEPFVKPNSAPALALKARNTSGGIVKLTKITSIAPQDTGP